MTIKEFLDLFAQENGSIKRAAEVLGVSETYYHMMYEEDKSLRADRFIRMLEDVCHGHDLVSVFAGADMEKLLSMSVSLKKQWLRGDGNIPSDLLEVLLEGLEYKPYTPDNIIALMDRFKAEHNMFNELRNMGVLMFYRKDMLNISPIVIDAVLNKYSYPSLDTMKNAYVISGVLEDKPGMDIKTMDFIVGELMK